MTSKQDRADLCTVGVVGDGRGYVGGSNNEGWLRNLECNFKR